MNHLQQIANFFFATYHTCRIQKIVEINKFEITRQLMTWPDWS